jgi:hypothetical protein
MEQETSSTPPERWQSTLQLAGDGVWRGRTWEEGASKRSPRAISLQLGPRGRARQAAVNLRA